MPLPSFSWANGTEVWNCMLEKDATYSKLRTHKMLERHPALVDSYRAILFDWLSEVSHECKFHRETYHLALDFVDRYLSSTSNVGKLQLQLIGTTCLFLAAKIEEIQSPTVSEFADLTAGACKPDDIIDNETVILAAIDWDITPMTPNNWLNTYMQILLNLDKDNEDDSSLDHSAIGGITALSDKTAKHTSNAAQQPFVADENSGSQQGFINLEQQRQANIKNDSFILPARNGIFESNHKRIASVVDLALLHIESLRFSNSILTASALHYFTDELTVRQCTGYRFNDLAECISWLKPFVETIKEIREPVFVASCREEPHPTQMHTHIATVGLLEKVIQKMKSNPIRQSMKRKACSLLEDEITDCSESDSAFSLSPTKPTTLLTPPRSARKSRRVQ